MNHVSVNDEILVDMLRNTKTIAMVGASPKPNRDSHGVMRYLQGAGYRVIPVNPTATGTKIHGETVYASLSDIPEQFEMVDVFRRPDAIPDVIEQLLPLVSTRNIRYFWLQLGITHAEAAKTARAAGLIVVMNRCLKIEHSRLQHEIAARGS